jgi:hypothetical protein
MAYTTQAAIEFTAGTGVNGTGKQSKISGFYVMRGTRRVRAFTGKDAEQKATEWAKFCNENLR